MGRGYLSALVIIILALITFAVALLIYFNTNLIKQSKYQPTSTNQKQSKVISESPSPPSPYSESFPTCQYLSEVPNYTDESHKFYDFKEDGFSVGVPADYSITDKSSTSNYHYLSLCPDESEYKFTSPDHRQPEAAPRPGIKGKGVSLVVLICKPNCRSYRSTEKFNGQPLGKTTVGGVTGDRYYYKENDWVIEDVVLLKDGNTFYIYYAEYLDQTLTPKYKDIYNNFLSTFKFLD